MLLLFGILQSILATLLIRYIAQGRDMLATVVVTANAWIGISALVKIIDTKEPMWYLIGVAIGTYAAMKWDKEKGE